MPSVSTNFIKLNETLSPLKRWIPNAALTNGSVHANKLVLTIPAATWVKGNLSADVVLPKNLATVLRASFTPGAPLKISVDSPASVTFVRALQEFVLPIRISYQTP